MVCITSVSFKVNFMTELILKVYFFQNSDKFPIGSLIENSKVLPVDKFDCFTEYVISIHIWNISIEIFKRAMMSFCRLSTSPSVLDIYKYCRTKIPCRRCEGIISSPKIFDLYVQRYLVVGAI